jgi:NAD(P)-dependent dehydrogenase (short-subunit alcohol dehydrogenase family)
MTLRAELAPQHIRVVEIMPGPVDTDMLEHSQVTAIEPGGAQYQAMAEHMNANKSHVAEMVQPAGAAASLIVDAILDDDGPMRYGCDPMSTGMIEAWRNTTDEQMMRGMLEALVPNSA